MLRLWDGFCCRVAWARLFLLLSSGLLCATGTLAAPDDAFSVQGFATLGAVRTTTDSVEFVRDLSQARGATDEWTAKTDSALGLQANWQVTPQWQAVAQVISRYRHDRTFHPEMAWAFVKFEPSPNLSLRAGRMGTEFFMLADSRWVGYSFLTVRPPGDYFWHLPFYSIHGADASLAVPFGEGIVRGKVFYGLSRGYIPLADEQWDIRHSPMVGTYLEYQLGGLQLRGSYANIRFRNDLPLAPVLAKEKGFALPQAAASYLKTRNTRTHYYSLGLVYDKGPFQAQLMLNHIDQGTRALNDSNAGYVLLGYRIGKVTPFIGYSRVQSREESRPTLGDALSDTVVAYVIADSHSEQKAVFVGARWDFAHNVALKAQWDGIRGDSSSLFPYRKDDRARWGGRMDVFSVSLDFVF